MLSCEDQVSAPTCNNAQRDVGRSSCRANLVSFADLLGRTYGVKLEVPETLGEHVPAVKEFCGRLLEPTGRHPWASILRRLPAQDRLSIAGSLFSFRKTLPSTDPDVDLYVRQMSEVGVKVPDGFLRFVRRKVRKLFRPGWDRAWMDVVRGTTPSSSSCDGNRRSEGGARANLSGQREWFLQSCIGLDRHLNVSTVRKVGIARCDGKARRVTTSPAESVVLKPLHDLLYRHISREEWLLRGEATPASFANFERKDGEIFVSGDYESASDGLSIDVCEHILDSIFQHCRFVPKPIQRVARESLRCVLVGETVTGLQRRGQLMGNYLCFPLLCLQNYLAYCFLTGGRYPVRINGDDIVFRAPRPVYERWANGVKLLGLTLSKGKTFVHHRFFSLNSTYFRARPSSGVKGVPIVRATFIYKGVDSADSMVGRFNSIGNFFDQPRSTELRIFLLKQLQKEIRCSQRSVRRGLGINASTHELARSGLLEREIFYSNLPQEPGVPSKVAVSGALPQGWVKFRPGWRDHDLTDDPEFRKDLVRHAWNSSTHRVTTDDYWSVVREGTISFSPRRREEYKKCSRLLRLSVSATRRYLWGSPAGYVPLGKSVWRKKAGR